jgi:hypothetical protein
MDLLGISCCARGLVAISRTVCLGSRGNERPNTSRAEDPWAGSHHAEPDILYEMNNQSIAKSSSRGFKL